MQSVSRTMDAGYAQEPNFRQVGTRRQGKLLVGATNTHSNHGPSAASIPSKFETILYSGDTEVDGFLSRVARFKPKQDDLPGAGSYHKDSSMEFNHDSISKKGYGNGFVSKTDRFFYVNQSGAPAYFPGPGSYQETDFLTSKNRANFNRSNTTANFKEKESAPLIAPYRELPGPGEYNPDALQRKRRSRRERVPNGHSKHRQNQGGQGYGPQQNRVNKQVEAESNQSFGSLDLRFKDASTDVPPPGQYNPDGGPGAKWAPNDYPSSNFASNSERDTFTLHSADNPGPAHYKPHEKEERIRGEEDAAGHNIFKKGQMDRFGRPLVRRKPLDNYPGPGTYDIADSFSKNPYEHEGEVGPDGVRPHTRPRMSGSAKNGFTFATRKRYGGSTPYQSTASISASLQHDIIASKNIRPPGPAYYNPDHATHVKNRSYHLNMKQKWV